MKRIHNFAAGPSTLPSEVIKELSEELPEYNNSGMSLIEMSHRGDDFGQIHQNAIDTLKRLCKVPDDFQVLLLQGGATLQFTMSAYNQGIANESAGYVVAGTWGKKAYNDASKIGMAYEAWNGSVEGFIRMPKLGEIDLHPATKYIHLTSNETINGVRVHDFVDMGPKQVIDMSSDFLTRDIPWDILDIAYGGAQKSIGPAGLCVVFVRKSIIDKASPDIPDYINYAYHAKGNSMSNTPPVFAIWAAQKMLKWIENQGGVPEMQKRSEQKSKLIYDVIDGSEGFYTNPVNVADRSLTNVVFRLKTEKLEKNFIEQAEAEDMLNLKGHRSVGGIRASLYNGLEIASAEKIASYMQNFASQMG